MGEHYEYRNEIKKAPSRPLPNANNVEDRSMSTVQLWLKRMTKFGLILMMGVGMNAEAGLFGHTKGWKEEVLLHDGKVLLIERSFNLGGYPTLDARERRLLDETITFTLPESTQQVVWKTDFDNSVPEPNSLGSLLLDIVGGVPYLATSPAGCIAYNKWGRPNPPYILFKYVNSAWQQIPLKEFPAELVQANLMNMPASSQLKPYYNVAAVKAKLADGNRSEFAKTILREAIPEGGQGHCPEMVPYGNGGWLGLDWFTDQPSLDACLKFCDRKQVETENCPCNSIFKGAK